MGSIHSTVPHSIWALNYRTVDATNIITWDFGWRVLSSDTVIFLKENVPELKTGLVIKKNYSPSQKRKNL